MGGLAAQWGGQDRFALALPPPFAAAPLRYVMANKQNQKGRSKTKFARFVQMPHFLLTSDAWRALPPAARAVYIEIAMIYNGKNNGRLALSVRDAAERCRINKETAGRMFFELEEKGLIERATPGSFHIKIRHAAEWRLALERCDKTGAVATKAFMRWLPASAGGNHRKYDNVGTVAHLN